MKKLILLAVLCIGISSCASKPGSGGGWVVGNPMMPEGMGQAAAEEQSLAPDEAEAPCKCKAKKKCPCAMKSN